VRRQACSVGSHGGEADGVRGGAAETEEVM